MPKSTEPRRLAPAPPPSPSPPDPPARRAPSRAATVVVLGLLLLAAGCGSAPAGGGGPGEPLRVALVPNQDPRKVEAEYAPLGDYLSQRLGREVELTVPSSYPAVVEAMANDRVDLALFGGLTYVQARQRAKVTPLVTDVTPETGTTRYHSVIVVPADSAARRIEDLRGKTFAFGSVSSTSGSLYPAGMLSEAGIDFRRDLERFTYTGGHDATAAAVASGKVDAGGLERRILERLVDKGTVEGDRLRTIQQSEPIEGYPWVVRDGVDAAVRERIAEAFLTLRDPKLLGLLNARRFERVQPQDYDEIERRAREAELLTETG